MKMKRAAVVTGLRLEGFDPSLFWMQLRLFVFPSGKFWKEARGATSSPVDRLHGTFRRICH